MRPFLALILAMLLLVGCGVSTHDLKSTKVVDLDQTFNTEAHPHKLAPSEHAVTVLQDAAVCQERHISCHSIEVEAERVRAKLQSVGIYEADPNVKRIATAVERACTHGLGWCVSPQARTNKLRIK